MISCRRASLWTILLISLQPVVVIACLWDYDTLRDEKRGLPGVAEILAGRWERHSQFFYEDRVRRMKALLAREPDNLAAYDNLAVAHEKLGDPDKAIEVMLEKERRRPGEYTTYANLGTFYLHKGDFDRGIEYIERALQINPDAHFGREEYQLKLAIYLRDARKDPEVGKIMNFLLYEPGKTPDAKRLGKIDSAKSHGSPEALAELGIKSNAIEGIIGMIRFGTGRSPDLYYALGDLLAFRGDKSLAYRAYQRAVDLNHPRAADVKQEMSFIAGMIHESDSIKPEVIAKERADAEAWVKAYQEFEDDLVRAGKDPGDEANYAAFYQQHGTEHAPEGFILDDLLPRDHFSRVLFKLSIFVLGPFALLTIFLVSITLLIRRRRRMIHLRRTS